MAGMTRTLNFDGTWARKGLSHVSVKRRQVCFADSKLELDAFLQAEFDDEITLFKPQPISFSPVINGRKLRYTPDILFHHRAFGYCLKEVKPDDKAEKETFLEDFAFRQWHAKRNWQIDMTLLKESEIRIGSTIENYERLYYYRVFSSPDPVPKRKLKTLFGNRCSFHDLKDGMQRLTKDPALPFQCLAWKQFLFEETMRLSDETELELRS